VANRKLVNKKVPLKYQARHPSESMSSSTNEQLWWMKYFDDLRLKCLHNDRHKARQLFAVALNAVVV
jgi:hypothetical protein